MSISLLKGDKINLVKDDNRINKIMIGLGWGEANSKKSQSVDCDASVILLKNGKLESFDQDVIFYNNLTHYTGAVQHQGDNLSGGDGVEDDEQIYMDLSKLPKEYNKVIFVVTMYKAVEKKQHFSLIKDAFIRICDSASDIEICRFSLSEPDEYHDKTALILGEMRREEDVWKFAAIGQGTNDDGILSLSKRFM